VTGIIDNDSLVGISEFGAATARRNNNISSAKAITDPYAAGAIASSKTKAALMSWLINKMVLDPSRTINHLAARSKHLGGFDNVALAEYLDADERPVCVIDLENPSLHPPGQIHPVFCNRSLDNTPCLKGALCLGIENQFEDPLEETHAGFRSWILTKNEAEVHTKSIRFRNIQWTFVTCHHRWRVITGNIQGPALRDVENSRAKSVEATSQQQQPHDLEYSSAGIDAVAQYKTFFQHFDWASTSLGPISTWSDELRKRTATLLSDPRPSALYWGDGLITMYNEAYTKVAGGKHPSALGKPFWSVWPEALDVFKPVFAEARETMRGISMNDVCFCIERNGFLEETYFSWSLIPRIADDGTINYYNSAFETTASQIAERRMSTLLKVGQCLASARDLMGFWPEVLKGLEPNQYEVPFALLYAADPEGEDIFEETSEILLRQWICMGTIAGANDAGPDSTCPYGGDVRRCVPNFEEAITRHEPSLLSRSAGTYPHHLVGDTKTRGFGDTCESCVLIPIRPTTGENVIGFLILGVNPRRPYDNDYQLFIQLLSRQLATAAASALLFEEEVRRSEMAARDKKALAEELAIQTTEATNSAQRFQRLSEWAPVGMFNIRAEDGMVIYANDSWYKLTQHPRDALAPMSWYSVIASDMHPLMDLEWAKLLSGETVSFELRLRKPWVSPEVVDGKNVMGVTWIIAAAFPEKGVDGKVKSVYGTLTDISKQKWAEDFHKRKMQEAMELKRQQERFIDVTSHEMSVKHVLLLFVGADNLNLGATHFPR
jgi:PAS domain-containing protein